MGTATGFSNPPAGVTSDTTPSPPHRSNWSRQWGFTISPAVSVGYFSTIRTFSYVQPAGTHSLRSSFVHPVTWQWLILHDSGVMTFALAFSRVLPVHPEASIFPLVPPSVSQLFTTGYLHSRLYSYYATVGKCTRLKLGPVSQLFR